MKKLPVFFTIFLCSFLSAFSQTTEALYGLNNLNDVKIEGYIGQKIDACILNGILSTDEQYLVNPFKTRNEKSRWQSEFWGKWFTAAADAYRYTRNPQLLAKLKSAASGLIATQTADGYIGNYAAEYRLQQWDIWGMKYCLLGLLDYYEITKDGKALHSIKKLADYVIKAVKEKDIALHHLGNYKGMAASSILEPMVELYNITNNAKYLEFAETIVESWSVPGASGLIGKALANVPVGSRTPIPAVWYGPENGQKAYEMMSCYEGLLELYKVKPNPEYLKAVEMAAENIRATEIFITGSGASMECWYGGSAVQSVPVKHTMEACVTVTWMKLCLRLLKMTANAKWADEIEKSYYNALLGTMKPDGSSWSKYIGIKGSKIMGEDQCGMTTNCCIANGPRGIMLAPKEAVMVGNNAIFVNFYAPLSANVNIPGAQKVGIKILSEYPKTGIIKMEMVPGKSGKFDLKLRIPAWLKSYEVLVNGAKHNKETGNGYLTISREWRKGDVVELKMDLSIREFRLEADPNRYALLYGPLVLASDRRYQSSPFFEFYTPAKKQDQIPYELLNERKQETVFLEMSVPFSKEIDGLVEGMDNLILTDFASSGNTWDESSSYQVWFQEMRNVSKER